MLFCHQAVSIETMGIYQQLDPDACLHTARKCKNLVHIAEAVLQKPYLYDPGVLKRVGTG